MGSHTENSSSTAIGDLHIQPTTSGEDADEQTVVGPPEGHRPSAGKEIRTPPASQKTHQDSLSQGEWRAGKSEWMIIIVIAIVSLMVALDATILVPVLPVSRLHPWLEES